MANQKTSLLINRQVPEFVREEYPNFIAFLEAYYEFLETKQGTQKNDLITTSKNLRYVSDVDTSIADFESNFFNTYAELLPREVEVGKATLIKHILPLYLAKGNEKSFKLLFRLLYDEEVQIIQPKLNVLKASDGKWLIENAFRISKTIYSNYTANGTNKTFKLVQQVATNEISVYVNGVLKTLSTDYYIRKESRKLIFNTAPASSAKIKVLYDSFDYTLLNNRKITGLTSGATAIIERIGQKTVNTVPIFELYINTKTLLGTFSSGENATISIIDPDDGSLIEIEVLGLSTLRVINIINGGASYNVGDPVVITGGNFSQIASASVFETFSGFINQIGVLAGGTGFKVGSNVNVLSAGAGSLVLAIDAVDTSGQNAASFFVVNTDRISDYGGTLISAANYSFNASVVASENVNTKIVDALTFESVTNLGPITNVAILFANASFATVPTLDADSAPFQANGTTHQVLSTHSIGRIAINNGGLNYAVGDELTFTESQAMAFGVGAAAAVRNVSANGVITGIEIQPARVRGLANTFGSVNVTVIGTNTVFEDDLRVGDFIMINNESRYINTISSNTSLTVNANFVYSTTNKNIGKYGDYPIGGQNYNALHLPTIAISSTAGANANLSIVALMGDGENLFATSNQNPGAILKIRIIDGGEGYEFAPQINLTSKGDGTATANAEVETSYITFPGHWTSSDSILSASERVIQGREYYVDYSYLLSSAVEFSKFREIFKNLIHPAGFVKYAEYGIIKIIDTSITTTGLNVVNTIAGTVNVTTGNIFVTGTNTKFNISNSHSILTVGSQIAVNSEIRTVNSIYSNGTITVSSAFTQTANDQTLAIVI